LNRVENAEKGALNVRAAAVVAGVSVPTMRRWVCRDDFPAFRSGRRWVIPRDRFIDWLNARAAERAML